MTCFLILPDEAAADARSRAAWTPGPGDTITTHLDLLTDLGMLSRVDTPDGPRWHRPQAIGA